MRLRDRARPEGKVMQRASLPMLIFGAVLVFLAVVFLSTTSYIVQPGTRGIKVTLGKAEDKFLPEGFGLKAPFITTIVPVNVRQRTVAVKADCERSEGEFGCANGFWR